MTVFCHQFFGPCMKSAKIVAHRLDNISVIFFNEHGRHTSFPGTGLSGNDKSNRSVFASGFSFYDGRPYGRLKEGIHFFRSKSTFFYDGFFCDFNPGLGMEKLVGRIFCFNGIGFLKHFNLLIHGNTMTFTEFNF